MDSDAFSEYCDQNVAETESLVQIGVIDAATARRIINVLRQRFTDFQYMSVTDRVDLVRDITAR